MPTLESLDYERFSFDDPLTLDEAVKKAEALRRKDASSFYRVEHTNESRTTFTVKKVPKASVYADFVARALKLLGATRLRVPR
jgi:hypothetical protein